jgi:uncharacterized protein
MSALDDLTAEALARLLDLAPHPEGGFYRETFRDTKTLADGRAASTAIYYLLPAGQVSAWHRVDAAEIWHWHAGAPLALSLYEAGGGRSVLRLGADLVAGERPQGVVPAGVWQSAESLGAWTLVGCTVAPGFEFAHFELAKRGVIPDR